MSEPVSELRRHTRHIPLPEPKPYWDEVSADYPSRRRCGYFHNHVPHKWTYRERVEQQGWVVAPAIDLDQVHRCPGFTHDHVTTCCTIHDTHTSPHRGCVLR